MSDEELIESKIAEVKERVAVAHERRQEEQRQIVWAWLVDRLGSGYAHALNVTPWRAGWEFVFRGKTIRIYAQSLDTSVADTKLIMNRVSTSIPTSYVVEDAGDFFVKLDQLAPRS